MGVEGGDENQTFINVCAYKVYLKQSRYLKRLIELKTGRYDLLNY